MGLDILGLIQSTRLPFPLGGLKGCLAWVRDYDVISLQDVDMKQWDLGSCLSGTTSKTEANSSGNFWPKCLEGITEHLISQIPG